MNIEEQQRTIENTLKENGISLVGFGDVADIKRPLTEKYPIAISIAIAYEKELIKSLDKNPQAFFKKRTEVIAALKKAIETATALLAGWGFDYYVSAYTGKISDLAKLHKDFSHKSAATRAGLGWIGRSSLLVTPEYGPRLRLASILTNAPFKVGRPIIEDGCSKCRLCADTCPYKTINNINWQAGLARDSLFDAQTCFDKGAGFYKQGDKAYRCGECLRVCPK